MLQRPIDQPGIARAPCSNRSARPERCDGAGVGCAWCCRSGDLRREMATMKPCGCQHYTPCCTETTEPLMNKHGSTRYRMVVNGGTKPFRYEAWRGSRSCVKQSTTLVRYISSSNKLLKRFNTKTLTVLGMLICRLGIVRYRQGRKSRDRMLMLRRACRYRWRGSDEARMAEVSVTLARCQVSPATTAISANEPEAP
jgi:hypothetical protein